MKVLDMIKELEEIVDKGNTLPFSSKALINPEEFLEILAEIREELPKEIVAAKEIVEEKKKILLEAQTEADQIKMNAEKRLEELINTNEITKNATAQAEKILLNAQNSAKEIRLGTRHYSDKMLYSLQVQLKELNSKIEENRKEIKKM